VFLNYTVLNIKIIDYYLKKNIIRSYIGHFIRVCVLLTENQTTHTEKSTVLDPGFIAAVTAAVLVVIVTVVLVTVLLLKRYM